MSAKRLIPIVPFAAALALVLSLATSDTAYGSFSPTLDITLADTTPGAQSDYELAFGLPEGDVNFGGVVGFIPNEWGIVDGRDIPVGAIVGNLRADATLGLINSPCNQILEVEFEMMNASLDVNDTVSFDDLDDSLTDDFAEDNDGNTIIDGIDHWPDFIYRTLDETEEEPIRRAAGMSIVASTPVLLQFLVFPPGTFFDENIPNDPALGYPSVTLLQNAGDPDADPEPGAITDFCSPLVSANTSFGTTQDNEDTPDVDEGGIPLFVNPTDGTYTFTVASAGLRDADGDGFENLLDTCPLDVNDGNPTISNSGDLDSDGLDSVCDPNDDPATGGTNSDQDGDGYLNRQDNCPLISNGEDTTNQNDEDLDQIGDVCDPNPDNADTEGMLVLDETSVDIVVGAGGDGPGEPSECPEPGCWSEGDGDGDGDGNGSETDAPDGNGDGNGTVDGDDDDGGSNTGVIIGIIVGVIAAVVVVGGGAALMMRRGGNGGASA